MSSTNYLYVIVDALSSKITVSELILNGIFITILIILSLMLYWDNINNNVNKISRCKRQMEIYDSANNGEYVVKASNKSKEKLFEITYDTKQYNVDVECKCPSGNFVNEFKNIPVKDLKKNKDVKVDKNCTCDKYYNTGVLSENIVYSGDPGIIRYMKTDNADFFDNLVYSTYG